MWLRATTGTATKGRSGRGRCPGPGGDAPCEVERLGLGTKRGGATNGSTAVWSSGAYPNGSDAVLSGC